MNFSLTKILFFILFFIGNNSFLLSIDSSRIEKGTDSVTIYYDETVLPEFTSIKLCDVAVVDIIEGDKNLVSIKMPLWCERKFAIEIVVNEQKQLYVKGLRLDGKDVSWNALDMRKDSVRIEIQVKNPSRKNPFPTVCHNTLFYHLGTPVQSY